MTCVACKTRGKTWEGDDPKCSFPNGGEFMSEGWNCATADLIRDLTGQDEERLDADYRYCDDQNYSTLQIDGIALASGPALALWVSWYKHRGRTDAMWLLNESEPPRRPTEADCVAISAAMKARDGSNP